MPVWLGDTIMATPAVLNLQKKYPEAKITIFGSFVATEIYKNFPNIEQVIVDASKKSGNRYINLYKMAKSLGSFDLAVSFRSSFSSKFLLFFINTAQKFSYKKLKHQEMHLVNRYNNFINNSLRTDFISGDLELFIPKQNNKNTKKLLGINPGATYGSAKRWYPSEFAKVAIALCNEYDIVIFGGSGETDIASDIENILLENGVQNYVNLAGKTSIKELCGNISSLDLFITNDSGPLHIAAAYKIKTIVIFGPTIATQTHGWNNPNEIIIKKPLDCAPCMKRVCPIGTHECMKIITAKDVLEGLG